MLDASQGKAGRRAGDERLRGTRWNQRSNTGGRGSQGAATRNFHGERGRATVCSPQREQVWWMLPRDIHMEAQYTKPDRGWARPTNSRRTTSGLLAAQDYMKLLSV